jgi:hypothetical protein
LIAAPGPVMAVPAPIWHPPGMTPEQPEIEAAPVTPDLGYEARYGGWNRRSLRLALIALAFCAVAFLPAMPVWLRVTDLVFFGGGMLFLLVVSASRPEALRVDAAGITLCRSPLFRNSATQTKPWPVVGQVVLWRAFNMDYVGVQRAPGAPPLSGRFSGRRSQRVAELTSGLRPEVAVTGVPASTWVLDRERLVAAVARFAPQVRVVDLTTPGTARRYGCP